MLEGALSTPVFRLHLVMFCVMITCRQRLIAFISINPIKYSCAVKNKIYYSDKRGPPPFFHSGTNPALGNVLVHSVDKNPCSGCNSGIDSVVPEHNFFQLCSNTEQISYVHKIQKKLCKLPCR